MPLFVRAGAIVPTGPDLQYVGEKPADPVTLNVYTGADGTADIYEDDGLTNNGGYTRIGLRWNERSGMLSIGGRDGRFPGMLQKRTFRIRWIGGPRADAANFDGPADAVIAYDGRPVELRRR
jgi:alpha-D-xyloside xylohydrolase